MRQRIITALLAIPAVLAIILYSPFYVFGFVCALAASITALEYFSFTNTKSLYLLLSLFLAVFMFSFGIELGLAVSVILFYSSIALRMSRTNPISRYIVSTARYSFAFMYIGIGYSTMILIHSVHVWLFLALLFTIWAADSFAYFGGKALGKHPMAATISPKKTWEGFAFGVAGSALVFALWDHYFPTGFPLPLLCGALIGGISVLGDMVESAIKRDAGAKDSGTLLAGHGGIFDRMDSLIFTAPFFYIASQIVL